MLASTSPRYWADDPDWTAAYDAYIAARSGGQRQFILDLDVNKDSVGRSTSMGFAIDTKHARTQVLVENGGTVVIGGIFTQVERNEVNKVPLLGDVPFVGALFRNTARVANKTELLIFITPKIVTERPTAR